MIGEEVVHIRFGKGRVKAFELPRIQIAFEDGTTRTFAYPQSVDRFIRFENEAVQQKAQHDREQAEILERENAMAKLLADRQRAEEAAKERMEALHEKKVASARRTAARSAAARKNKATGGMGK